MASRVHQRRLGEWLKRVAAYREQYPGQPLTSATADMAGHKIGRWVAGMRRRAGRGELDGATLTILVDAGIIDHARTHCTTEGREGLLLDAFESHLASGGSVNPPRDYRYNGLELGSWLDAVRRRHRRGTIAPGLKTRLEMLGVAWVRRPGSVGRRASCLDVALAKLEDYLRAGGQQPIPAGTCTPDGFPLGRWAARVLHSYRSGKLGGEKRELLVRHGLRLDTEKSARGRKRHDWADNSG